MAFDKNQGGQKILVYARDTSADEPKGGDAANITAYLSKDAASPAQTNDVNPTELHATNAKGVYVFELTQEEPNCDVLMLYPQSSTSNVELEPVVIYTTPGDNAAIDVNAKELDGDAQ